MRINLRAVIPALVIGSIGALSASATPATSTLSLGVTTTAQVGATFIDFGTPFPNPTSYSAPGTYGQFEVSQPVSGTFQSGGVVSGEFGGIQSLDTTMAPVNTMFKLSNPFLTFSGTGGVNPGGTNLELFLTFLNTGNIAPNSPFSFLSLGPTSSVVGFSGSGYLLNTTTGAIQDYNVAFSDPLANIGDLATLLSELPFTTPTPVNGTITLTATPEPASLLLMGVGLLGAGIIARKKVRS